MTGVHLIARTCTEIATDDSVGLGSGASQPLSAFRHVPAYVLLGEPGSGKTIEFEQECAALDAAAAYITAREFRQASGNRLLDLRDKILFIDGLDETRAGGTHGSDAVDEIQARLLDLGQPAFRISCRVADWFGPVDRSPLSRASPDGRVATLHLDRLSRSDAHRWLEAQPSASDAAAFLLEASSRGFESMLESPQSLEFLFESVTEGDWPATRTETFRRTCERLASEPREDHPRASEVVSTQKMLNAAGRVFAVQLLSGSAAVSFRIGSRSVDCLLASDIAGDPTTSNQLLASELRQVMATSLFKSAGDQCFESVHRQVAEYLGAVELADLIGRGVVSAGRVCAAVMSPADSRVVTDMRGLAAWLGTQSAPARRLLINADPVGVALYGDISEWPVEDRRRLLDRLVVQARPEDFWGVTWFDTAEHRYRHATGWSFRSLCQPDMTSIIGEILDPDRRNDVPDHVRELLLYALSEADGDWLGRLSSLAPHLSQLALDATTQPDVRLAALLAFARIECSSSEVTTTLSEALDAVSGRTFADPDDRIAGSLLRLLYPEAISPGDIWKHAALMHRGTVVGEGWTFWSHVLCDETPAVELASLLDGFAAEAERLWPILSSAFAEELPWKLLTRAVQEVGHEIEPQRLYHWIAAVAVTYVRHSTSTDEQVGLLEWLAGNEAMSRELVSIWIARSIDDETGLDEQYFLGDLLLRTPPPDFVEWCAQQARVRATDDRNAACAFVEAPLRHRQLLGGTRDALIERLRSELASDPLLLRHLDDYIAPSTHQLEAREADRRHQQEIDEIRAGHERDRQERQADWSGHLRELIDELRANTFPAQNLHTLAMAYFGRLQVVRRDAASRQRISDLIGDDAEILDAVIGALREAPLRTDVPSARRTAELTAESKHDWLAYPVLAGLAIREVEGSLDTSCLPEDLRRSAVAIYATTLLDQDEQPLWPAKWLREDPQLVLDVCHRCALAELKKGDTYLSTLDWLAGIDGLDDDLRDFRLRLLKSISVRLPVAQLPILDHLLHLASKHPCTAALQELVVDKLQSTSMTGAQRVRWLALDAIMHGGRALGALDEFIDASEKRPQHLAEFLCSEFHGSTRFVDRLLGDEPVATIRALVGIVGRSFSPRQWKSGEVVRIGPAEEMSDLVSSWINELGSQPTAEAGAALDTLIADDRLSAWRKNLEFTRDRQRRLHRDASYEPMGVAEVLDLLRNGPPANIADLHALVCDQLHDIGVRIRGSNTDLWQQFWADDQESPPTKPKREESCRNALLEILRNQLPEGVDVQPEGQYAADRRADIRAGARDFNVPVEIKKNTHTDLWTAIEDQLIAKYTTDPETGGYGIYVVLWFGSTIEGYRRHPSDDDRPHTPDELARRLNESLGHEQRRKIGIVVLDVTKP